MVMQTDNIAASRWTQRVLALLLQGWCGNTVVSSGWGLGHAVLCSQLFGLFLKWRYQEISYLAWGQHSWSVKESESEPRSGWFEVNSLTPCCASSVGPELSDIFIQVSGGVNCSGCPRSQMRAYDSVESWTPVSEEVGRPLVSSVIGRHPWARGVRLADRSCEKAWAVPGPAAAFYTVTFFPPSCFP